MDTIRIKAERFVRENTEHYLEISVTKDIDGVSYIVGLSSKRLILDEVFDIAKVLNRKAITQDLDLVFIAEDGIRLSKQEYFLTKRDVVKVIEDVALMEAPEFYASMIAKHLKLDGAILIPILADLMDEEVIYTVYEIDGVEDQEYEKPSEIPPVVEGIEVSASNIIIKYYINEGLIDLIKKENAK